MREFFIFFSYFAFAALAFTCAVITYQIVRYGIGKTTSASETEEESNVESVNPRES